MDTNAKHYFLGSHTGKGYAHFFNEEMQSLDYVYVLKSVPGNGQTDLIQHIASHFQGKGERLDLIHHAADADKLEGLILKDRNIGVLEGTWPHVLEPKTPYVDGEYVDLTGAIRERDLEQSKDQIHHLKEQFEANYQGFSDAKAEAFSLHEDLEKWYSGELDTGAANQLAEDTIQAIFGTSEMPKEAAVKDRFVEASTESKHVDFVQELTKDCTTRYFITGRPGSGKSVFMKTIAEASRKRGYDVERYHCGFDPDSLDLILLPELGIAAFDSTPPHDHKPSRDGDEMIDTAALLKIDSDEVYKQQITDIKDSSQKPRNAANESFRHAVQVYREIAELYTQAVDFDKVEEMEDYIIESITS